MNLSISSQSPPTREAPQNHGTQSILSSTQATQSKSTFTSDLVSSAPISQQDISQINSKIQSANKDLSLQFDLDDSGNFRSFKLVNQTTQEVIVQIPSEQMLAIRDQIDNLLQSQPFLSKSNGTNAGLTGIFLNAKT